MRIACVYSLSYYVTVKRPVSFPLHIHHGLSAIIACLKRAGHDVELLVLTPGTNIRKVLKEFIGHFRPRLFCLTSVSTQFSFISGVAAAIKEVDPGIFIVVGGHHASLSPEEVISSPHVDAICVGEGEDAVVELARQLGNGDRPSRVPSLWIKDPDSGRVERNPTNPFKENLDSLPFTDRRMWVPWIASLSGPHPVLVGRGCVNRCIYCSNHAMARLAKGRYVRYRSPKNIIEEIRLLLADFNQVREIYLEIECMGSNLEYTHRLLSELARFNDTLKSPVCFGTNLTPTGEVPGNLELLEAFRRANFKYLNVGLETGSERIRREVLRRPEYTNKEIVELCRLAGKCSIDTYLYVIMGLPGETRADLAETVRCVRNCQPKGVSLEMVYPYPGTKLYRLCLEQGLLPSGFTLNPMERRVPALKLPDLSSREIHREYILFLYKAYKMQWPWLVRVYRSLRSAIGVHPLTNRLWLVLISNLRRFGPFRRVREKFHSTF